MQEFERVRDLKTGKTGTIVDNQSIFNGKRVLEIESRSANGEYEVFSRFEDEVEHLQQ